MIGAFHHPHNPRHRKAGDRLRGEWAQRGEALEFGGESHEKWLVPSEQ